MIAGTLLLAVLLLEMEVSLPCQGMSESAALSSCKAEASVLIKLFAILLNYVLALAASPARTLFINFISRSVCHAEQAMNR